MSCIILATYNMIANQCQENSTRLVNGSNSSEGRVEVCIRSSTSSNLYYGGVCDHNLDDSFATVVCRELNLTYGKSQGVLLLEIMIIIQGSIVRI